MKHLVVVAVVAAMTGCAIAAGQGQSLQRPAKVAVYAGVGVGGIGAKMLPPGGIACRDGKEAVAFAKKAAGPP